MANQWAIEIRRAQGGGIFFLPFVPGSMPGDDLQADAGDAILWSNRTTMDVELESTSPAGLPLDQKLAAGSSSLALFIFPGGRVEYKCKHPEQAHGIQG